MTTKAAAAQYLAEHKRELQGRKVAIYNPSDMPVESLPVIYGFNNGGPEWLLDAVLLAEDGTYLGSHCCSDEGYMPHDLGILEGTRPDRHERFKEHYPDGYRMEFVGYPAVKSHKGLNAAFAKINKNRAAFEKTEA